MTGDQHRFRTPWLDQSGPHTRTAPRAAAPRARSSDRAPGPAKPRRVGAPGWVRVVYFVFGLAMFGVVAIAVGGNGEAAGLLLTIPVVLFITHTVARRLAILDRNPQVVPILMGGVCLKVIGSLARYWASSSLYGTGDSFDYDKWGRTISSGLRHGHLVAAGGGRLAGTNFMRYVTGFLYVVTPARMLSGFVVYSFLSFIGLIFFWRAYRLAISPTHDTTYLQWLVLMPSLVYWPSAIGKDAFMLLAAGVAAYGVACVLANRTVGGLIGIALGVYGMIMVRPHFALAVCGGLMFAVLARGQKAGFVRTIINLALVVALAAVVVQAASSFFGLSSFNQASIVKTLNDTSNQSSEGGSAFTPVIVHSPVQFPLAAITVLYRPAPFEAHSPQEVLTALEGTALFVLTLRALRRSGRALRRGRDYPYFLYCLGGILVFIIAFSGFSNFGILARERSVIQPLFLVFLSLPKNVDQLLAPRKTARRPQPRFSTVPTR
jgi:hypothetical protein